MQPDSFNENALSPAEVGSKLRGLRRRYAHNTTLIQLFESYGAAAAHIKREMPGMFEIPGLLANVITAIGLSNKAITELWGEQESLEREIAELTGQIGLWQGYLHAPNNENS